MGSCLNKREKCLVTSIYYDKSYEAAAYGVCAGSVCTCFFHERAHTVNYFEERERSYINVSEVD